MAILNPIQKSFNGGEFSPLMAGRLDLEKFPDSCRELTNAICLVQGPATRRGAWRKVAETKTSAKKARIIPFEVGTDAAYVLELGDLYVRFYKDGARIESPAGTPVEVATTYLEADLFSLHYAQSADLLYLVAGAYAPRKLSRLLADGTSWGFKQVNFAPPPTFEDDTDYSGGTIKIALSALTGAGVKVVSSAALFLAADKDRLLKYLDARASFTAYVGTQEMTAEVLDEFPAALIDTTPVATLTTDAGVDKTIINFSAAHGITAAQATAGIWLRLTSGAQTGEMRQVASVTDADTVVLTAAFSVVQAAVTWSKHYAIAPGSWKFNGSPVATLTPSVATPVGAIATLTLGADGWRAADVTLGKYVKAASGIVKLTTYTSPTVVSGQIVKILSATSAVAGGAWSAEVPSWSATAGYPSAICFFEERLLLGGTTRQKTTVWGSANGDYENFGGGGVNAADSATFPLTSIKANIVRWLLPAKSLLGGTVDGEFSITGEADAAITPTNPRPRSETTHGGSTVMPVRVGHLVIFVQAHGRKVRELTYDYQPDAFIAPDLTRFAEHITKGGIVDMAYQQEPYSVLWCVRADGVLLGLTYIREEKVYGWQKHVTDGAFESICVIPDPANNRDQLWAVVRRTIGGVTKRFIEVLEPDVVAADSFAAYSGAPATVITGLSHLEGKAVDVVADGFEVPGHVVAGGRITLSRAASDVVVGLHYETVVEPHRPDYVDDKGRTTIGKKKKWTEVILRLHETGLSGVTVNGATLPARAGSDPLGTATALFTGDVRTPVLADDSDGILTIRQTKPLPFTLVAITGSLNVGD